MKTYTVTMSGEVMDGIQTVERGNSCQVVELGTPKYEGNGQPFVPLDPVDMPEVDGDGIMHEGELLKVTKPDYRTGFLGWVVTKGEAEDEQSIILRARTSSWPHSNVTTLGAQGQKGGVQVKGVGYTDLSDRNGTAWADSLHTLSPGRGIALNKINPKPRSHRGNVVINAGGQPLMMTLSEYCQHTKDRLHARQYLRRVMDDEGQISPNARSYRVAAALATLMDNPHIYYLQDC